MVKSCKSSQVIQNFLNCKFFGPKIAVSNRYRVRTRKQHCSTSHRLQFSIDHSLFRLASISLWSKQKTLSQIIEYFTFTAKFVSYSNNCFLPTIAFTRIHNHILSAEIIVVLQSANKTWLLLRTRKMLLQKHLTRVLLIQ